MWWKTRLFTKLDVTMSRFNSNRCVSCVTFVLLFSSNGVACGAELSATDLSEIRRIEAAIKAGDLPSPPGWTFNHGATDEGQAELERLGYPDETGKLEDVVRKAGGWSQYKSNVAALLKSKDPVVRGFMAIWLADFGDASYSKELHELLTRPKTANHDDSLPPNWDRGQAACALGVLGAREYSKELSELLQNSDPYLRAGAAEGLSWMGAKEFVPDVAVLLDDRDENVRSAAIDAIARLNGREHIEKLMQIATDSRSGIRESQVAMFALVALKAQDQAAELAKLLEDGDDSMARGNAIIALAALDAHEYAKVFASILEDENSKEQDEALLALGMLKETEFAPNAAKLLASDDRSVRQAAVWSLIMMEATEFEAAAMQAHSAFEVEQSAILHRFPPKIARQLEVRFNESWQRARSRVGR